MQDPKTRAKVTDFVALCQKADLIGLYFFAYERSCRDHKNIQLLNNGQEGGETSSKEEGLLQKLNFPARWDTSALLVEKCHLFYISQ